MKRDFVFRSLFAVGICVLSIVVYSGLASLTEVVKAAPGRITQGALSFNFALDGKTSGSASSTTQLLLPENRHLTVYNEPLLAGAIKKVMPVPPSAIRASGVVKVRITFNTDGEVEEAEILTGHPLLRASVIQAARQWQFKPTGIDGVPIKFHGVLAFKFTLDKNGKPTVVAEALPIAPSVRQIWRKLHPSVSALIERLAVKDAPTANEATFVQDGKASLEVRLADKTDVAITQLKKLGFEVVQNSPSSKLVIG